MSPDRGLVPMIRRFIGPDTGWVAAQAGLLAAGVVGGLAESGMRGRDLSSASPAMVVGAGLLVASALVLGKAARDLSSSLTMSPTPVDDSRNVVDSGIYGIVRHPMYTGALLAMGGYALVTGSWLSGGVTMILIPFLAAKSRHEEQLLMAHLPGYEAYRGRVRYRFIPWVV